MGITCAGPVPAFRSNLACIGTFLGTAATPLDPPSTSDPSGSTPTSCFGAYSQKRQVKSYASRRTLLHLSASCCCGRHQHLERERRRSTAGLVCPRDPGGCHGALCHAARTHRCRQARGWTTSRLGCAGWSFVPRSAPTPPPRGRRETPNFTDKCHPV